MKTRPFPSICFICVSVLSLSGCISGPVHPPLDDATRLAAGRVAVVVSTDGLSGRLDIDPPDGFTEQAGSAAVRLGVVPGAQVAAGDGKGAIVGLLWMPIGATVGGIYGLVVGESGERIREAAQALEKAGRRLDFNERLRAQVLTRAGQTSQATLFPAPSGATAAIPGTDSVLDLHVFGPGLDARSESGPVVSLCVHVRVRLVSARNGRELYYDYLEYRGHGRRFCTWAENDARLLRDEVEHCLDALAAEIIAQIFTRPTSSPIRTAELKAFGLTHR
jgi:hypothetical protein